MTAALLTIGTELTRGELRDKNGGDLAEQLTELGFSVTEICSVDDDDTRIIAAINRLALVHRVVLCTGGLGPTTDDRTSLCAARALGVPLTRNIAAYEELIALMKERGRPITPSSEKQADFPEGATVLRNPRGTAPGFSITKDECVFFFMPGVPSEMERMFDQEVRPRLPAAPEPTLCLRLRTYGLPEVEVNDRLQGLEESHQITIGYRASHSEIEVKIIAAQLPGEEERAWRSRANQAKEAVLERLGAAVYTEGTTSLCGAIGALLRAQGKTIGFSESCTGGLVSQMMTSDPGASEYYVGGVVTYANSAKERILGVDPAALRDHGAVSEMVARQMAEGARRALGVDVGLSFTGIAGPGGGSEEKPVGLVHFAVATDQGTRSFRQIFRGTRAQIQRRAALAGLWQVRALLLPKEKTHG